MNFQINYKMGKEKLQQFKLGVMEYFIQYTSNREAEYVTIDYVLPIKQVDHYPMTDDCVKSTIRDSYEAVLRSVHMIQVLEPSITQIRRN